MREELPLRLWTGCLSLRKSARGIKSLHNSKVVISGTARKASKAVCRALLQDDFSVQLILNKV